MKREFSAAAAWSGAASWIEQAAGAVVFVVIARIIGVENFGIAAMAFAFLFLGEFLVRDTITEAIIERKSLEEGRLEATFVILVGFSAIIVLILLGLSQVIARIYGEPSVAPLLAVASPTVLLVGIGGVSTALLRRRMEYKTLAIRTIVGVVAGGVVGIAMALNDFGAWSLVGQRVVELSINTLLAILGARWWPRRLPSRSDLGMVRGLGFRVLELRFWTLVVAQTPTVMLGIFADPRAAGLFAFSARLVEVVLKVTVRVIQGVAQSAIAALRRQTSATSQFFLDLSELSAFVGFLSFTGLALIASPLTRVLLGPDWDAASEIIPFLCILGAAMALEAPQEAYLLATDRLEKFLKVVRLQAVIGLLLIGVASLYGAVAVGIAVALRALVVLPLFTKAALSPEGIGAAEFLGAIRSPVIVSVVLAATLGLWRWLGFGQVGETLFVALSVSLGVLVAIVAVIGFMPATYARLKSYVQP